MLLTRLGRAPTLASRVASRRMSTLNVASVTEAVAKLKAEMATPKGLDYTAEQVTADAANGKIDVSKIGSLFEFLDDDIKKDAMKTAAEINHMKRKMAEPGKAPFDWAAMEADTGDKDLVAAIKGIYEQELLMFRKHAEKNVEKKAEVMKTIKADFAKPGGLYEQATKFEKDAHEEKLQLIVQLEELESQLKTVEDITIAELLENDPTMRKEVEEEIAGNNWAPDGKAID